MKKQPSLADQAYAAIRSAIISNQLTPGEVLTEESLAEMLGISRTPIRAALQRLGVGEAEMAQTVMVGDRKFDVEGAAECGLPCIGVEFFDFAPPGELESAGALAVCQTAKELEQYLLEG